MSELSVTPLFQLKRRKGALIACNVFSGEWVAAAPDVLETIWRVARGGPLEGEDGGSTSGAALQALLQKGIVVAPAAGPRRAAARPALVATVREPGPALLSFVRHHRRMGFQKIYLFFDDPADRWLPEVAGSEGVSAIPVDVGVRARYRELPSFPTLEPYLGREVMARQILNVEIAQSLAHESGCDWLLHLDGDEALAGSQSAPEFFGSLPPEVAQVRFLNDEGVAEREDIADYFREVTLFRRHPIFAPPAIVEQWRARFSKTHYFLGYENGKSAVRLGVGARPLGVHGFDAAPAGETVLSLNPHLLHFINCGFDNYRRKYLLRGRFPDRFWDNGKRLPFHAQSRDALAGNDGEAAGRMYRDHVMCQGSAERSFLLARGLGYQLDLTLGREPALLHYAPL
jgi:hypothetical protein